MEIDIRYCAEFHESANRPHLLVGCEPTPIVLAFVIAVVLGYSAPTWWGISGSALLFLFLREVLRGMAKEDPIFMGIHFESQRYNQGAWTAKPKRAATWRSR